MTTDATTTDAPAAKPKREPLPHHAYSPEYRASMASMRIRRRVERHIRDGNPERATLLLDRAEDARLAHHGHIPYRAHELLREAGYIMRCLVAAMTTREADVRGQLAVLAEVKRELAAAVDVLR